tara:strand:- start:4613 stop:4792 length:180 start_codon:yes stop_codon:yes gene_type:complete
MASTDQNIIKKIEINQKFADYVYKDFSARRFGITSCCSLDQLESAIIKKELCDWQDLNE